MTDSPPSIQTLSIKGTVDQLVNIPSPEKQGEKNWDDFNLRLGLVLLGSHTLKWYQEVLAADWVKEMFKLAPEGQGIDRIYFLNAIIFPISKKQNKNTSSFKIHYRGLRLGHGSAWIFLVHSQF